MSRDFNTVSPSALTLLEMKALTDIPYAGEAVRLLEAEGVPLPPVTALLSSRYFIRGIPHFENRYKTIDALLQQQPAGNILELSSGFSFRGLEFCARPGIFYIDTDLPDLMQTKQRLVARLQERHPAAAQGSLQLHALNVLDEAAFRELVAKFPPGPVTIVNEGLLMYLNSTEKQALCRIIHSILEVRGGCWITGDIYLMKAGDADKNAGAGPSDEAARRAAAFLAAHQVEENKFESFEAARHFFMEAGFEISDTLTLVPGALSSLKYLPGFRDRETWLLKIKK